jgi:hypothetical protein
MIGRRTERTALGILFVPCGYRIPSNTLGILGLSSVIASLLFLFLLPFPIIRDLATGQRRS